MKSFTIFYHDIVRCSQFKQLQIVFLKIGLKTVKRVVVISFNFIFPGLVYSVEVRVNSTKSSFFEGDNITLECYSNLTEQHQCIRSNTNTIWLKRRWESSLIIRGESKRKLNLTLKMSDTGNYSCEIEGRLSAEFNLRVQGMFFT